MEASLEEYSQLVHGQIQKTTLLFNNISMHKIPTFVYQEVELLLAAALLDENFHASTTNEKIAKEVAELVNRMKVVLNKSLPKGTPKEVAAAYTPFRDISLKYDQYCTALATGSEKECKSLLMSFKSC
eukprot:Phypoly_transcript_24540.p1 GENE.Phypoly_transcript_24540~~Phypoly_transcript_24540.p1  ORF type:complete len:146 (+),score=20.22 Phypoly_transcript_24540:55-438(+)